MVDPNCRPTATPDPARYRERMARVLARADIVKASDEDFAFLALAPSAEASARLAAGARRRRRRRHAGCRPGAGLVRRRDGRGARARGRGRGHGRCRRRLRWRASWPGGWSRGSVAPSSPTAMRLEDVVDLRRPCRGHQLHPRRRRATDPRGDGPRLRGSIPCRLARRVAYGTVPITRSHAIPRRRAGLERARSVSHAWAGGRDADHAHGHALQTPAEGGSRPSLPGPTPPGAPIGMVAAAVRATDSDARDSAVHGRGATEAHLRPWQIRPSPRVTVSLVTFNGSRWLPGCLASLAAQDLDDVEIRRPGQRVPRRHRGAVARVGTPGAPHAGPGIGHERGLRGRDTTPPSATPCGRSSSCSTRTSSSTRGFLSAIVAAFEAHPEAGSVQPRLRQLAGPGERLATLDTTGLVMGRDRRAVSRAQGSPDGPEHQGAEAIWVCEPDRFAHRLSALREAALRRPDGSWEVLDEDFFLYKEDVDLAWRLRRLGWAGVVRRASGVGLARTRHRRHRRDDDARHRRTNRGVSARVRRLSWRNQRLMQIKNEDRPRLPARSALDLGT